MYWISNHSDWACFGPAGKELNWDDGCSPAKLENALVKKVLEPMPLVPMVSTIHEFTSFNSTSVYSLCYYILGCEMVRSHKILNLITDFESTASHSLDCQQNH